MIEPGGNACLDIRVGLKADPAADEVETAPKELHDLVDRHKRRSHRNIESPLEVLRTESEPNIVFVVPNLKEI